MWVPNYAALARLPQDARVEIYWRLIRLCKLHTHRFKCEIRKEIIQRHTVTDTKLIVTPPSSCGFGGVCMFVCLSVCIFVCLPVNELLYIYIYVYIYIYSI